LFVSGGLVFVRLLVCLVARLFDGWFAEIVRLLFCADLLFLVCVFCVSGLPPSTSIPYWVFLVVFPSLLRLPCWSPTLRSIYIFMGVSLYIFLSGQGERRFSSGDRVCPVRVPRPQEKIYINICTYTSRLRHFFSWRSSLGLHFFVVGVCTLS